MASEEFPVTGRFGEPRKYTVKDCPHKPMEDVEHSDGTQSYFCKDCGGRFDGDDG